MSRHVHLAIQKREREAATDSPDPTPWMGSMQACWDRYVVPHQIVAAKRAAGGHDVYWMHLLIGNLLFHKIGMSQHAENRMKSQSASFPIAAWKMHRLANVRDIEVARQCESNMLVACRHLIIKNSEYLRDDEYAMRISPIISLPESTERTIVV